MGILTAQGEGVCARARASGFEILHIRTGTYSPGCSHRTRAPGHSHRDIHTRTGTITLGQAHRTAHHDAHAISYLSAFGALRAHAALAALAARARASPTRPRSRRPRRCPCPCTSPHHRRRRRSSRPRRHAALRSCPYAHPRSSHLHPLTASYPRPSHYYYYYYYYCLLYTSPSPRDQRGSRMPSSA